MNTYYLKHVSEGFSWDGIPTLTIENIYKGERHGIEAYAQIAWADDAFHVHMWTIEPETYAESKEPFEYPADDSCLEFFFSPMEETTRYFNIEFNSLGCFFFGLGTSKEDLIRLVPLKKKDIFSERIIKHEDGWEIFYTVPYELIRRFFNRFEPFVGKKIRANCYKCSVKGNYPHYLTWNPNGAVMGSFHNTDIFGEMIFVD